MDVNKKYAKLLKSVAHNIKKTRELKGLTQEEMVRFGFNYRHYQRIESGKHSLNLFTLQRLASAFKVSVRDFFG